MCFGLILSLVGIFRYLQRSALIRVKNEPDSKVPESPLLPTGVVPAAAMASAISTLCMAPES